MNFLFVSSCFLLISLVYSNPISVSLGQKAANEALLQSFLPMCKTSQYICSRNSGSNGYYRPTCVNFEQLCDGNKDCPNGDDESNELCESKDKLQEVQKELEDLQNNQNNNNNNNNQNGQKPVEGIENDFSGTGFMFSVENLIIEGGSNVKMFNQNSDNLETK